MSELLRNIPALSSALERARQKNERFQKLEVKCDLPHLGSRSLSMSGRAVPTPGKGLIVLLAVEDVTKRQRGEVRAAESAAQAMAMFAESRPELLSATSQ